MRFPLLIGLSLITFTLAPTPRVAAQLTPDQQAEMAIIAARKMYNDGNFPAARDQFKQFLQKFGNDRRARDARYGLGLCFLHSPEPDFLAAIEPLTQAANDGGHPERGFVLYHLAVAQRSLGLKETEKPKYEPRFQDALRRFIEARDWFASKQNLDWSARCRCDQSEIELRLGRIKEARATTEPFTKDENLKKSKHRQLGLYYHGLACFQDHDFNSAGRALNQLAPFQQPAFGVHARYLVGRVQHQQGELAEASVHYDAVIADHEKAVRDAKELLKPADAFKGNPIEKARVTALANGATPEYVAGALFHSASLAYESGKFPVALTKFQSFEKSLPQSTLIPDTQLRIGLCLVQLKQYDEAVKVLTPLPDKTPRLADQAYLWLGKARVGIAQAVDTNNVPERTAKLTAATDALRKAVEKAQQIQPQTPESRLRKGEALIELGDALYLGKQYPQAHQSFEQAWNERLLPDRRHEELLQRLASASGAANDLNRSDQWCQEFLKRFPQSTLMPAIQMRLAETAYARALAINPSQVAERKQKLQETVKRFQEIVDRYPEFERVQHARYAMGICLTRTGDLEAATKVLEAIPAPDRNGELSAASYLLADCWIRLAPDKAEDALAENILREKLTAASGLLENYVASNAKSPDAPEALLKLGLCLKRLGSTLADANERNQLLNKSREFQEKLIKDYPQSPQAGHARLEISKLRALMGDRGGAMNDLRAFLTNGDLQKSPMAPLALLHLATLHREQNQPAEAVKVLEEARKRYEGQLANDKDRVEWLYLLKYHQGVSLIESQKLLEGQKVLEETVNQARGKPIGAEAGLRAGQAALALARKSLEDARKERAKPNLNPQLIATHDRSIQQAREQILQTGERMERWAQEFAQAMPTGEPRARLIYDAAWAYRSLMEEEIQLARKAISKDAPDRLPLSKVPVPRSEERATAAYNKLISEFGDTALSVDARFELAELRGDRDVYDTAIKLLRDAIDKEPSDRATQPDQLERIRLKLGSFLYAKKDYKAAASQLETLAGNEKSPHRFQAIYRLGECLLQAGDGEKATAILLPFRDNQAFQNQAGISDRALLRLAQAQMQAKNLDQARQTYDNVRSRYGNSPFAIEANYGLGHVLQLQGKYDEAVNLFDQVVKATTAEVGARAQLQIGLCRMQQKRYAEAASALMLVPYTYSFPELEYAAVLEASRAYVENKQPEQAEKILQKLIKDCLPNSEWARAAKERLLTIKK